MAKSAQNHEDSWGEGQLEAIVQLQDRSTQTAFHVGQHWSASVWKCRLSLTMVTNVHMS